MNGIRIDLLGNKSTQREIPRIVAAIDQSVRRAWVTIAIKSPINGSGQRASTIRQGEKKSCMHATPRRCLYATFQVPKNTLPTLPYRLSIAAVTSLYRSVEGKARSFIRSLLSVTERRKDRAAGKGLSSLAQYAWGWLERDWTLYRVSTAGWPSAKPPSGFPLFGTEPICEILHCPSYWWLRWRVLGDRGCDRFSVSLYVNITTRSLRSMQKAIRADMCRASCPYGGCFDVMLMEAASMPAFYVRHRSLPFPSIRH